jgi:hypothetical protein
MWAMFTPFIPRTVKNTFPVFVAVSILAIDFPQSPFLVAII